MLIHVLISHGVLRETGREPPRSGVSLVPRASSPQKRHPGRGEDRLLHRKRIEAGIERRWCCRVQCCILFFSSVFKIWRETSRGFEPRSLDSESRVLTVTPRGRLPQKTSGSDCSLWKYTLGLVPLEEREHFERSHVLLHLLHISLGG